MHIVAAYACIGRRTTGGTTAQGASGPQVTHSVATTTASGVTVVTTTRSVNGKTVVSRVRQGGNNSFADN